MKSTTKLPDHFQTFRVISVSKNTNSFGLSGHILVAKTGEAWEVARSRCAGNDIWELNQDIAVPLDGLLAPQWGRLSCELPRQLPRCPKAAVREIFTQGVKLKP